MVELHAGLEEASENEREEVDDDDVEQQQQEVPSESGPRTFFTCSEEGCSATFLRFGNLQRHLEIGKHMYHRENINSIDFSVRVFKNKLESFSGQLPRFFRNIPTAVIQESKRNPTCQKRKIAMGWAISSPKPCKKFDTDVKAYLLQKYEEGEKTGGGNPKKLRMTCLDLHVFNDMFMRMEVLDFTQISIHRGSTSYLFFLESPNKRKYSKRRVRSKVLLIQGILKKTTALKNILRITII